MLVFALTLVRHGETVANKDSIIQGQSNSPLSELGLNQAKLVAERLKDQEFTHVHSSDLTRATQTAEAILTANPLTTCSIVKDARLRERKFGNIEGKSFKELKVAAQRAQLPIHEYIPEGAETVQQMRERAVEFFRSLCQSIVASALSKDSSAEGSTASDSFKRQHSGSCCEQEWSPPGIERSRTEKKRSRTDDSCDLDNWPQQQQQRCASPSNRGGERPLAAAEQKNCAVAAEQKNCAVAASANHVSTSNHGNENAHSSVTTGRTAYAFQASTSVRDGARTATAAPSTCVFTLDDSGDETAAAPESHLVRTCENLTLCVTDAQQSSPLLARIVAPSRSPATSLSQMNACPNVSLFSEGNAIHRVSSCDSNSIDDYDIPQLAANVLVTSHGGFLREFIRHLVDALRCECPGGRRAALRTSPNTGISKFVVSMARDGLPSHATCVTLHDKEHLTTAGVSYTNSVFAV
ncbi:PREDICTED: fructose-2,6-bisphosphatase TIGAR-like [Priapulus caudatus]|uniref:Fructose-2,6-bisphosphatase TIGAR n=1 Tax=Priapulus caudatus TaxID=37621 RepID=A0ABM1ECU9_PRICU|nr:PREDICTED: fructose-2,6-bisphosphatase TIGAR-like [Priapulus caudatus]XP_014670021.1 PREDICTED: fructose-2,6-bisphosphatase TIGAR-like [Priapulus caudatus]XP_014670022.1 PREDICTED: fructose-2,6-bisphosphatase TIGAR-like [Priapulus caudatus]XP_014670023.1 PREDICTED: fructose-2,6-bisphosphatase TIGAR-like [Priapulus caudatus]